MQIATRYLREEEDTINIITLSHRFSIAKIQSQNNHNKALCNSLLITHGVCLKKESMYKQQHCLAMAATKYEVHKKCQIWVTSWIIHLKIQSLQCTEGQNSSKQKKHKYYRCSRMLKRLTDSQEHQYWILKIHACHFCNFTTGYYWLQIITISADTPSYSIIPANDAM